MNSTHTAAAKPIPVIDGGQQAPAFHERRYPLTISKRSASGVAIGFRYGPWNIEASNWMRPDPSADWDWSHDDYDGAPDGGDHRCGAARNPDACIGQIHAWEDEQ